ncbi:hypothetical protein Pla123a_26590 [Posidoniimonas polymericola]|uniref:Uncharacterized protein n=1 Tax=Posidoniimonas polymericola TaxID=2528002 RepID=A0A5C5YM03_9BACT|nr:hypothetical protein [Posidoniimonas polymericola]TWT75875.1 hypothetical protein Pla123a_26590 [Posidoniimonas polymericola]
MLSPRRVALVLATSCLLSLDGFTAARSPIPGDWIAALTVRDPLAVAPKGQRLAGQLGAPWIDPAFLELIKSPEFQLAGKNIAVGLAAPSGDVARMYPFFAVPTTPATLAAAFGGDLTGQIAIFSINGVDFAARERRGATLVVPLAEQAILLDQADDDAITDSPSPDHDLTVRLSERGLDLLRGRVEQQSIARDAHRRFALTRLAWPPSAAWVDAAIGGNLPLADRVAELFKAGTFGLTLQDDGGVAAEITAALRQPHAGPPPAAADPKPPIALAAPREPIATLSGDATDGSLRPLVGLTLAYARGRPDEIEASTYPEKEYAEVEEHALAAVDMVTGVDATLLARSEADPFYSNRLIGLQTTDSAEFAAHLEAATDAWNRLVAASDARVRLSIEVSREGRPDQPMETRFTTDLGAAIESPPSAATREIMQKYYGKSGLHVTKLVRLDGNRVLLADVADEDLAKVVEQVVEQADESSPLVEQTLGGSVRLDRYANWQNAILNHYMADAIGYSPPANLDEAPLSFEVGQGNGSWRLKLAAPESTLARLAALFTKRADRRSEEQ